MEDLKKKLVLVGGGGHCKVVIDAVKSSDQFELCGIVDPNLDRGISILGIEAIGDDSRLLELFRQGVKNAFITVGSIGDCSNRKRIYDNLKNIGFQLPVVVHPKAVIARDVELGEGTFIAAGAVVNPGVRIGKNVIINTSVSIDHDCKIADFVHIAPGATLCGGVEVADSAHVGAGAKVRQCVKIAKNYLVKMGTVVTKDLSDE